MSQVIKIHPMDDFKERSRSVLNDPGQRKNFRGAMDYLQAKRRSQFPDEDELQGAARSQTQRQRRPGALGAKPRGSQRHCIGHCAAGQGQTHHQGQVDGERGGGFQPRHGSRRHRGAGIRHG